MTIASMFRALLVYLGIKNNDTKLEGAPDLYTTLPLAVDYSQAEQQERDIRLAQEQQDAIIAALVESGLIDLPNT